MITKGGEKAGEFQREIDKLEAHGGGDCPENTFAGIREALEAVQSPGSPLYVFTDAGPKDATEKNIVLINQMVVGLKVPIYFLITGKKEN